MRFPPEADELEVSIFGPGVGECVLVHLGFGEWIVVDSCIDRETNGAVALRYLRELGVDPAMAIKLIVVTHWHDDHIRGVRQVVEAAPNAEFACSGRDRPGIFQAVATARQVHLPGRSGVDEFSAVLELLKSRRSAKQREESVAPRWASEGQLLFQSFREESDARVTALSPSSSTQTLGMHELAEFLPERAKPQRRAVVVEPNERSVVLWVEAGGKAVLLGGDLEETQNPATGWRAVLDSAVRPAGRAEVFKVPHHGSENADNPSVWTNMLTERPVALLAPYARGSNPLPSRTDIDRLLGRTNRLFSTGPPRGWNPPRRDPAVEKTIKGMVRNRRAISGGIGQGKVRWPLSDEDTEPRVDLIPPARQL